MYASTRVFQSSPQSQSSHHWSPADSEDDFDEHINQGNEEDVSLFLGQLHRGLRGGPLRDKFDGRLLHIVRVPGTSTAIVMYDGMVVGVAFIDQEGNVGTFQLSERFAGMAVRAFGKVAL